MYKMHIFCGKFKAFFARALEGAIQHDPCRVVQAGAFLVRARRPGLQQPCFAQESLHLHLKIPGLFTGCIGKVRTGSRVED